MPESEADTCRKLVTPKIYAAGWTDEQISEQAGRSCRRSVPQKGK